jgi:signal transduction histidine kinase
VVLMDCRMPGAGGVAATREIVKRWPEVAVVAHTTYADETYVREMVEQLLQASAFVANRSPVLRAEDVMVAEVVQDWKLAEPDRRVELRLPDRPRSTHGDAEAPRMVVGNLVDNAGKHAPPSTPIGVLVSQPDGLTRIEVADQGDGVPPIDRERIFAPFTQLDASTTRRVGGVGLGLFLVDRLVRGMGGRVWVEDNQGGGARFVVELPDLAPV